MPVHQSRRHYLAANIRRLDGLALACGIGLLLLLPRSAEISIKHEASRAGRDLWARSEFSLVDMASLERLTYLQIMRTASMITVNASVASIGRHAAVGVKTMPEAVVDFR